MRNRSIKIPYYVYGKEVYIQYFDMALIAPESGESKKWYLLFSANSDTVTVDQAMPEWYTDFAILAEAIANNKVNSPEVEILKKQEKNIRIVAEKYCLARIGNKRTAWLKARKEYYNLCIAHSNNSDNFINYAKARDFIEKVIKGDNGSIVEYLKSHHCYYETRYSLTDFSGVVSEEDRKWLVYFTNNGDVLLDKTSPKWYRKLASLAEEIGVAGKYPELINRAEVPSEEYLFAKVEEVIIERFSYSRRKDYINARVTMFQMLVDKKLNTDPGIIKALEYLKLRQQYA